VTWFLVFLALCFVPVAWSTIRAFRGDGFYVLGQRQSGLTILLAWIIILIAFGLFAAIQLGFIPNHAP
jgi:hypothetical protein